MLCSKEAIKLFILEPQLRYYAKPAQHVLEETQNIFFSGSWEQMKGSSILKKLLGF